MDVVENNIRFILDGLPLQDSEDLCDFTLADQNEATGIVQIFTELYIPVILLSPCVT